MSPIRSVARQIALPSHKCKHDPHALGMGSLLYNQLLTETSRPNHVQMAARPCHPTGPRAMSLIWDTTKSCSQSAMALKTNYKLLHHWYLTPTKIAKFTLENTGACFRGCPDLETYGGQVQLYNDYGLRQG